MTSFVPAHSHAMIPSSTVEASRSSAVEGALGGALAWLASQQAPDGSFDGTCWLSVASTAQVVIVERRLGVLDPEDARLAVRFFESMVRQDGSFPAYHGATFGTLADSAQVVAALHACGVEPEHPLRRRVQGFVEARGGLRAVDPLTLLFLALAGLVPADALPGATLAHLLVPGLDAWAGRTFQAYYSLLLFYLLPGLTHGLRGGASRLDAMGARRVVGALRERQNPQGNWVGGQWITCLALACLHELGVPVSDDAVQRGLAAVNGWKQRARDGLRVMPFDAAVWNAAVALRVLHSEGAASLDLVARAHDYLLGAQCRIEAPRAWSNRSSAHATQGGWSFCVHNPLLSDTDTTAIVILALQPFVADARIAGAVELGERWLLEMQNDDGGFAAVARGQRGKGPGPLFRANPPMPETAWQRAAFLARPPLEFVDHATADLTGRVLSALAARGLRAGAPLVDRAVAFIAAQREGDAWFGRWTTNYIASGAFILQGLHAVGVSHRKSEMRRAVAWLLRCQNRDGGFGERNESYANPGLAGRGPSNAYSTGLVLSVLCEAGLAHTPEAARAVDYLLDTQGDDHTWTEVQALQTLVPPELFYTNRVNFQTAPIEALGAYRRARGVRA
jgi:squalene-hopene/tetraprenyl-beta-curcumene cyclase